jgi:hypothetical protein
VADLTGWVRRWSLGKGPLIFSLSADVVTIRLRLGTLGRLVGGVLRKPACEGGGEGSESIIMEAVVGMALIFGGTGERNGGGFGWSITGNV